MEQEIAIFKINCWRIIRFFLFNSIAYMSEKDRELAEKRAIGRERERERER
jgi:hypothetical protein